MAIEYRGERNSGVFTRADKIKFLAFYIACYGNLSKATLQFRQLKPASKFGRFNRQTVYAWRDSNTILDDSNGMTFGDYFLNCESKILEDTDEFLKTKIYNKKDLKAMCFFLKHRHPDYQQRLQVNEGGAESRELLEQMNAMIKDVQTNTTPTKRVEESRPENPTT